VAQIVEDLAPGSVDAASGRLILPVQGFLLKTSVPGDPRSMHVSAITRPSASTAGPGATTAGSLPV
jgi:hypothetical protein